MKTVELYTDGACSGNPGVGGWGCLLRYNGHERELSGGAAETTNNRMELTAAIEGLRALREPCRVELYTDSRYIEQAFSAGWLENWLRSGWRKSDKSPVLNRDLWEELHRLTQEHEVSFHWVRGHAENEYNNRCDKLAVEAREKLAQ